MPDKNSTSDKNQTPKKNPAPTPKASSPSNPPSSSHDSHSSHNSHDSHSSPPLRPQRLLQPRGDYHTLLSYQKAHVLYQLTYRFTEKFLSKGDRTVDQMLQSARSAKQNIVEGSKAAATSKETEIKLTNVARASMQELLEDYLDYLEARKIPVWEKDGKEALYVRKLGKENPLTYEMFQEFVETRPPGVVANIAVCLIHQANYLLDRQLESLGTTFLEEGGFRERMSRMRRQRREEQQEEERWKWERGE